MAAGHDAQAAGERVEALLAELGSHAGPQVAATAEELVACLVELYGAGLAQVVAILAADEEGPRLLARRVPDPLGESLLLGHTRHPPATATGTSRPADQGLPRLAAHAAEAENTASAGRGVV